MIEPMSLERCDVFVLAAGRGARLRPLTDTIPKALVPVGGKPLIAWNLELLARAGSKRVIINLCYLGDQIRDYVNDGSRFGVEVVYVVEEQLLDTGGSIKNIEDLLRHDQLFTINSDVLVGPEFSPGAVLAAHRSNLSHADLSQRWATMVLRNDPAVEEYGALVVDRSGRIVEFLGEQSPHYKTPLSQATNAGPDAYARMMFCGIQVLERSILDRMPPKGGVFSITRDTERKLVGEGELLCGFEYSGYWNDVGTPDRLAQASNDISRIFPQGG